MIKWNANFQIPNSGVQAGVVYAFAERTDNFIHVDYYAEPNKTALLFSKDFEVSGNIDNVYDYLLTLKEFENYERV